MCTTLFAEHKSIFEKNERTISREQFLQLEKYVSLLLEANKKVNLISRKDEGQVWENHILHSLSIYLMNKLENCSTLLDLGTGGGLPGIPIKIVCDNVSITLLDSTQKKIRVVSEIVKKLGLKQTNVACGRAEELGKRSEFFGKYDVVVSRAVAPLNELIKLSKPFLKKRGTLLALKGGDLSEEIRKSNSMKLIELQVVNIELKGLEYLNDAEKKLVVVKFGRERG